jgi:hypothetical protein
LIKNSSIWKIGKTRIAKTDISTRKENPNNNNNKKRAEVVEMHMGVATKISKNSSNSSNSNKILNQVPRLTELNLNKRQMPEKEKRGNKNNE